MPGNVIMAKTRYRKRNGLILPDSGLVLPESRSDSLPWYARGFFPDSRRWANMGSRRCCCETCTIFTDDFAADDLATNWTQQSGSWSIGSDVLSTSSSNAVLTCDTTYPGGGFHNHVIQVNLLASNGNRSRIIFSYDSGTGAYNYIEVYCIGSGSYVYIKKSDGTTIKTVTTTSITDGNWYTFNVCVSSTAVVVTVGTVFSTAGLIASSTTTVGLGTGSISGSLSFDSFVFSKHMTEKSGCPSCTPPCSQCSDGFGPERFQVVITGVAAYDDCPNCNLYNGTWILKPSPTSSCCWESDPVSGTV